MTIQMQCPKAECGRALRVREELAGKTGKCPSCGALFKIPILQEENPEDQGLQSAEEEEYIAPARPKRRAESEEDGRKARPARSRRGETEEEEEPSSARRRPNDDDAEERRPARRRRADDENEDESRPARARRDDDEEDDAPARTFRKVPPRRKGKRRPKAALEKGWFGNTNAGLIGGALMMVIAVVWFVVGLVALGYIFFYPPVLFVIGLAATIKGLIDYSK